MFNHETVLPLSFVHILCPVSKINTCQHIGKIMLEIDNCFDCADKERGYFVLLFLIEMSKTTWRKINFCTNSLAEFKRLVNVTKARQ